MESLIPLLLWAHIAAGFIAFFMAPAAMLTAKGGPAHRRWGKVYFRAMAAVALTAVLLAAWRPNVFLLLIAVFSFYLAFTGYRALRRKRPLKGEKATALDWAAAGLTCLASAFLVLLGIVQPGPVWQQLGVVAMVLGGFGVFLSANDMRKFLRPPADRNAWWFDHMGGMLGSYAAALSAFSVVNFTFLPPVVRWLWPAVLATVGISAWIAYYKRKFARSAQAGRAA
jgi:uncharacterized membrane protein